MLQKKNNLETIKEEVRLMYSNAQQFCMREWFFDYHVNVVANYAKDVAARISHDSELPMLAALLHDIARTKAVFNDPQLMSESLKICSEIMNRYDYNESQIDQVKLAIIPHACKKKKPTTEIGKILATADALAHLMSDIYLVLPICDSDEWGKTPSDWQKYKKWVLTKLERDINDKIFYDYYRKLAYPRYEMLKDVFAIV